MPLMIWKSKVKILNVNCAFKYDFINEIKNILILRRHGIMAWLRCLHHQSSYLHHIQHQIPTVFHETDNVQSRISQKCT